MAGRRRINLKGLGLPLWKLVSAGPNGWWLLLQAQLSILVAAYLVRYRSQGDLVRELGISERSPTEALPDDQQEVEAIGLAIDRVARIGFGRPLCLVRSLALQRLLVKRGVRGSRIRVGVRMKDQTFQAHAWVEWAGTVVAEDSTHVESFRPFLDFQPQQMTSLSWTGPGSLS